MIADGKLREPKPLLVLWWLYRGENLGKTPCDI
jgi:hypothetical protein